VGTLKKSLGNLLAGVSLEGIGLGNWRVRFLGDNHWKGGHKGSKGEELGVGI